MERVRPPALGLRSGDVGRSGGGGYGFEAVSAYGTFTTGAIDRRRRGNTASLSGVVGRGMSTQDSSLGVFGATHADVRAWRLRLWLLDAGLVVLLVLALSIVVFDVLG
jgi:hypothetical protein